MSRVRVHNYPGEDYYATRSVAGYGWMVHGLSFWGPTLFYDHEVERIPAHRGAYDPGHWGEDDHDIYDAMGEPKHRKEGEPN